MSKAEEIEELKRYEEGNMYTYKYTEIPEKINELVKAVNKLRKEKFERIKNEYNKRDDKLQKEREELYDEYKNKLKEIGIKYD